MPRHRWTPTGTKTRQGLPEDVAAKVVVRDNYWLPDEAASLFAHAQAVVSIKNHSPIIAAAVGTPFLRVHQSEDSIKADMFRDIGLGDWYIPDINKASGADISAALMSIVRDLPAARRKLKVVMGLVAERQAFGMRVIRRTLGLGPR